ncbi:MAG TPA: protein-export chaperone SecB [Sphingomicrobium sp.]|nr:protein-export chaperone SecB [Sphingomicrobium sp.]
MADDDSTRPGNGSDGNGGEGPQAATLAQYIKDLSVESPSAPQVFQFEDQPALDVNFNLNVEQVSEDVNEVVLKVEVRAQSKNGVHFLVDLTYAGLFGVRNFPEEAMGPFLLVEAPRMLFPFARQIVCESIQNMGFPPLLLEPVDFAGAYMAQAQAQVQGGTDGAETPEAGGDKPGEA